MPIELPEGQVAESAEAREERKRNERAEERRENFLKDALAKYESLPADAVTALTNAVRRLKSCAWDEYDGEDVAIYNVSVVGDDVVVELDMKEFGFIEKRKIRIADFV